MNLFSVGQFLGSLFEQPFYRWVVLLGTSFFWYLTVLSTGNVYLWDMIIFVEGFTLWVVSNRCYVRVLRNGKGHFSFWWRYAAWMSASVFMFSVSSAAGGIFVTFFVALMIERHTSQASGGKISLRGAEIDSVRSAARHYDSVREKTDPGILWGGVTIPFREATTHFCVAGTSGSGKTVTLRLFMQDVLPGIGQAHSRKRAVIYDPKLEMYPILVGMGIRESDIIVMNPFDQRCRPWAIAEDIKTPTDAQNLAEILVPEKEGSNSNDDYWRNASILLIKAVVRYLNRSAPNIWRFRDLLLSLRERKIIIRMIEDDYRLNHYKQAYGSDRTADNIMSTLLVQIERYEPIAALWHKAETVYGNKPVSLTAWTNGSALLLLGKSETAETEMREINRVIITRLSELLLEKEETREPSTFIILDELASLGNMKPLIKLAEQGRSKGVSLAIGFQSKEHLEKNFSKELANTFLGQFNHIAALRLRDEQTARWISELIGKTTGIRYTSSESSSWGNPSSHTLQEQYYEEYATQISELTSIPPFRPDQGIGLKGLYLGHTYWWNIYSPRIVESLSPKAAVPAVKKTSGDYQEIEPWEESDYQRLHITHFQDISFDQMENFLEEEEPEP
jgi:type IV secretory pathway TraG/TraD family ATPase VirD4